MNPSWTDESGVFRDSSSVWTLWTPWTVWTMNASWTDESGVFEESSSFWIFLTMNLPWTDDPESPPVQCVQGVHSVQTPLAPLTGRGFVFGWRRSWWSMHWIWVVTALRCSYYVVD